MSRLSALLVLCSLVVLGIAGSGAAAAGRVRDRPPGPIRPELRPTRVAFGHGRLVRGVLFLSTGPDHFAWNFRAQRIGGSDRAPVGSLPRRARGVLLGLAAYRARNPHIDLRDRVRPHVADGHRWSVRLARELVRAMLDAGADRVLIGPRLRIGTSARVISGPNHDDRLHAMF